MMFGSIFQDSSHEVICGANFQEISQISTEEVSQNSVIGNIFCENYVKK